MNFYDHSYVPDQSTNLISVAFGYQAASGPMFQQNLMMQLSQQAPSHSFSLEDNFHWDDVDCHPLKRSLSSVDEVSEISHKRPREDDLETLSFNAPSLSSVSPLSSPFCESLDFGPVDCSLDSLLSADARSPSVCSSPEAGEFSGEYLHSSLGSVVSPSSLSIGAPTSPIDDQLPPLPQFSTISHTSELSSFPVPSCQPPEADTVRESVEREVASHCNDISMTRMATNLLDPSAKDMLRKGLELLAEKASYGPGQQPCQRSMFDDELSGFVLNMLYQTQPVPQSPYGAVTPSAISMPLAIDAEHSHSNY